MKQKIDKKDVYKEVFVVLAHFNSEVIKKIPSNVFSKLVDLAADSKLEVNIDVNRGLDEQNLSEESKSIISLIYYKYIADDDEKKEIIKIWEFNDNKPSFQGG